MPSVPNPNDGEPLDKCTDEEWDQAGAAYTPDLINVKKPSRKVAVFTAQEIRVTKPVPDKSISEPSIQTEKPMEPHSMPAEPLLMPMKPEPTRDAEAEVDGGPSIKEPNKVQQEKWYSDSHLRKHENQTAHKKLSKREKSSCSRKSKAPPKQRFVEGLVGDVVRNFMTDKKDSEVEIEWKLLENGGLSITINDISVDKKNESDAEPDTLLI